MRRIILAAMGTLSSLVLLMAYPTSHNASVADGGGGQAGAAPLPTADRTASAATSSAKTRSGSTSGTYTGTPVQTRWGVVQVRITVHGGRITAAEAVRYPNDNGHDQEVNAYALPILAQEVLTAQSASIDAVSGATVTSGGYVRSLQSALDAAHL